MLVPVSICLALRPCDGMLPPAAGHSGVARRSVRAQDAVQRLRRAIHEAGEEEVGRAGDRGRQGSLGSLRPAAVWAGIRYSGSLPMSNVPSLSLKSPCAHAPGELPVLVASAAGPVELCGAHCSVTQT